MKAEALVYAWYAMRRPRYNADNAQVCELDRLIPLELGGADGLGNMWPQCGPDSADLNQRYFRVKDRVERYLAAEVGSGRMSLREAQSRIASDWTQNIAAANL